MIIHGLPQFSSNLTPLFAGLSVMVCIGILTPVAERIGLTDTPNFRKFHYNDVPVVGGIAIYLVLIIVTMILRPADLLFYLPIIGGLIVVVGALDDLVSLGVRLRLAAQVVATSLMIVTSSVWIKSLGDDAWGFIELILSNFGLALTVFAVVGLTNAFNMVDGLDGLSSGQMIVSLATLAVTLLVTNEFVPHLEWLASLGFMICGFWFVNLSLTPLKKVFLGDAGSLLLGFVLAWILIFYTQNPVALLNPVAALWCVTIPVFDTLAVIARRIIDKRSPFSPDRAHLHHLLLETGLCPRMVLALMLGGSIVFNALGIFLTYAVSPMLSLTVYTALLVVFAFNVLHPRCLRIMLRKIEP